MFTAMLTPQLYQNLPLELLFRPGVRLIPSTSIAPLGQLSDADLFQANIKDTERGGEAAERVEQWRTQGTLPFPEFGPDERERFMDSLDYPPRGSPQHRRNLDA